MAVITPLTAEAPPPPGLPPVAVVGCHGGCGATTVTRLLAPAAREVMRDQMHTVGAAPLLLVARSTAYGLSWATRGITCAHNNLDLGQLAAPPLLVLVADSPLREPPTVRARLRLVRDRVQAVVRVPYVAAWRDTDDPLAVPRPRALVTAMSALQDELRGA